MPSKEPKKTEPKAFLLRLDPEVFAAVRKWAADDLRSVNGQIEFLLRQALLKRGVKLRVREADGEP
ncbi:MAG TPA: Arc family DNA-binding protein [Fimbriiglobus sp.]|nr:Arc family DNA-binding protein [Fimbriiglobus sp.]